MARKVFGGVQDFAKLREGGYFYVDKTAFIKEWWAGNPSPDQVTLITRPRRFGKTLMLSTVAQFFSTEYAGRSDLFEGLEIWKDAEFRALQGTYPVIFLSLAAVKGTNFATQREQILRQIIKVQAHFRAAGLQASLAPEDRKRFTSIDEGMSDSQFFESLNLLCELLHGHYGKKAIILLDEYDTPLQEAWVNGFWQDMVAFLRNLFNATFKSNPYLERALLSGITRVSKESMFSDLNNIGVYTVSTPQYMTSFGFTEAEVLAALDEFGLTDREGVRTMYDGYTFGTTTGIYNPWSICCYLKDPRLNAWWSDTSSNALVGKLIQEGSAELKLDFQTLLEGGSITSKIDEQIVFNRLTGKPGAVWSLLLASGYLKALSIQGQEYELQIVNGEVRQMFENLLGDWFADTSAYGNFVKALLCGDLDDMNEYMNKVALACFSSFDTGGSTENAEPERFYHGFVLGLLVELRDRYILTSNRESGSGRYDVMLEPRKPQDDPAFIIEFKVHKPKKEKSLEESVAAALAQIEAKGYEQHLLERGIPTDRIRKYGFAFRGKEVLIG